MAIPEEWHNGVPKGVQFTRKEKTDPAGKPVLGEDDGPIMVPDKLAAIGDPASKFLVIDYEVAGRYQKEDLQMDDSQARFFDSGTDYFGAKASPLSASLQVGGTAWRRGCIRS